MAERKFDRKRFNNILAESEGSFSDHVLLMTDSEIKTMIRGLILPEFNFLSTFEQMRLHLVKLGTIATYDKLSKGISDQGQQELYREIQLLVQ